MGCASAACATGGGGINDENIPSNHEHANAIPHQRPMTNENDEAMGNGAADCALDLAGTIDGLLRASSSSTNAAAGTDPLFHASNKLAIPSALSKESRSKSIAAAHRMFHHDDVVAHDDEVRAGAFDALVFRLGFSVGLLAASSSVSGEVEGEQGTPSRQDEAWSELAQIVSTLSKVCRCSHSYRLATFNSAAQDQLLPLLFHVTSRGREVLGANTSPSIAKNASEVIVGSLGVLRSYSKVADIRPQLLKPTIAERLLPGLAGLLQLCARKKKIVDRSVRIKIEKDALGLLKDVTHRCSESEARLLVVDRPGVLEAALEIGILANKGTGRATSHRRRNDEYLATVLWNCASHRSVRAALLSLGKEGCSSNNSSSNSISNNNSPILSFLSSVLYFDSGSQHRANYAGDDGDDHFELQKAALSCLGNLCRGMQDGAAEGMDDERIVLVHDEGIFVERLLSIATHAPASSSLVCRRRAVRTIRCLVGATSSGTNADDGNNCVSAMLGIASQRGIDVLGELSNIMKNDDDENVQIHAAESVATLYEMLTTNMTLNEVETIEMLNNSFICVIASTAKNAKRSEIACRCLWSASVMIDLNKQSDLFPSLLGIVRLNESDSDETHKLRLSSLKLIRVLSTVETNRPIMLREEGRIGRDAGGDEISFGLLHCLSLILKRSEKDYGCGAIGAIEVVDLQKEAAAILVELSHDDSAQSVVDYPDLLSSFTHYCTNAVGPSGPERDEAKKALMRLVARL